MNIGMKTEYWKLLNQFLASGPQEILNHGNVAGYIKNKGRLLEDELLNFNVNILFKDF